MIERAAAIMRLCRDAGLGLSLRDIADQVNLPRSTVQRIVRSLSEVGFLSAGGKANSIRLGPEAMSFSASSDVDVIEVAQPLLKQLAEVTGETVDLARLRKDHLVFINQISGSHRLRTVSAVGEVFPLHCSANGKAALAIMSPTEFDAACPEILPRLTDATITSRSDLVLEIDRVRTQGYAVDLQEHTQGICAVGVAFRDPRQTIYALSIPVPSIRFPENVAVFRQQLIETRQNLIAAMASPQVSSSFTR